MGAVARIPFNEAGILKHYINNGVKERDLTNTMIKELCAGGFFVPLDIDERKAVESILDRERDTGRFRIMILPHENCNFRCVYCYEDFSRNKMSGNVVQGLKKLIRRKSKEFDAINISWFGGEPLLAHGIVCELTDSFIKSCDMEGTKFSSGMTTNGYLLTPKVVGSLLRRRIRSFQVSLDGPELMHNRSRRLSNGNGTYKRIFKNLMLMKEREEEFYVSIRVNFDNKSNAMLEDWLEHELAPYFSEDQRFGLFFKPIGKWGGPNDLNLDVCDPSKASSINSILLAKAQAVGFSDIPVKKYLVPHGTVCYAASKSAIIVGSDGTIYKCSLVFNDPRNIVGKLDRNGNTNYDNDRLSQWTSTDYSNTSQCELCHYFPCCQARTCPLATMDYKKPGCPITREVYKEMVRQIASKGEPISAGSEDWKRNRYDVNIIRELLNQ
jgi:uncharacterized protein